MQRIFTAERLRSIPRFLRYLLPYWDKQAVLYLCMGISVLVGLMTPYITSLMIDYALLGKDLYLFNVLLILGVTTYLFSIPIGCLQEYTGFYLSTKVALSLRADFYRHMQLLSLRFAQSRPVGEHLYRLGPDLDNVGALIIQTIPSTLVALLNLILLLAICLWINWKLTLFVLLASPMIFFHVRFFTGRQYGIGLKITQLSQNVSSRLQDAVSHLMLTKMFGREHQEYRRYIRDIHGLVRLNVQNMRLSILRGESGRLLKSLIVGGLTYYLGYQIIRGRMSLGHMTALTMYLFQLLSSLKAIGSLYDDYAIKFIAVDRVAQTLDAPIEVETQPQALRQRPFPGPLSFEDVTFGYGDDGRVLEGIRFSIGPGQYAAFVGPSGAGKTTLTYLLLRLYDPLGGSIRKGGVDIRGLYLPHYRKSIGLAFHDPSLFSSSIMENIRFGSSGADLGEVMAAAEIAEAHDYIQALPDGYETEIRAGGHTISVGQEQRLAIARAIVSRPSVLVLDEAMSSISSDLELKIIDNIRRQMPETMLIVISHRLSAIQNADRIFVINSKSVEDEGTHSQLLNRNDTYRGLFREQLADMGQEIRLADVATAIS